MSGGRDAAWRRVADGLASELARGLWQEGDALPPEIELARSFGVGRRTLRRALAFVERDGLIAKSQGRRSIVRGTLVEAGGPSPAGFLQAARAARRSQVTRLLRREERPATLSEARALGLAVGAPVTAVCRLRLLGGRPAVRQLSVLPAEVARRLPLERLGQHSLYEMMREAFATAIEVSQERISLATLDAHEAQDLALAPGAPAILVRRLMRTRDRRALEFSLALIASTDVGFTSAGHPPPTGSVG